MKQSVNKLARRSYNVVIKGLHFPRDSKKARTDFDKHGLSFEEASSVFYEEHAVEFCDDKNSEWEDRFPLLGPSSRLRLFLVRHCYRETEGVIRIVSARKATPAKLKHYRRI
jgi:uncharacterized protein